MLVSDFVRKEARKSLESDTTSSGNDEIDIESLPDRCNVRRELYPWNTHEPDRVSDESLHLLNEQMSRVAPQLEVCATELLVLSQEGSNDTGSATVKQLGVFAKSDIQPGETVLEERSLLTANSRLHDAFCDACSLALPNVKSAKASPAELEAASKMVYCPECDDTVFCSQECRDLANSTYHAAVCSTDVEAVAKDAPPAEAADALYALLLLRAIAMAETQDVHPLDLPEVKYIWGDYKDIPGDWLNDDRCDEMIEQALKTLPYSFKYNVLLPLHMLEKMDVNIFATQRYDTWVLNTLYAKFRGTASARQGPDGRPEVGAVHPMWCLANHSCDPNVSWEWGGSIRFWARQDRVLWEGKKDRKRPGLKKGEEVFNHYCDIELPVKERREWAAGALGGMCMCERCVWEDAYEKAGRKEKA